MSASGFCCYGKTRTAVEVPTVLEPCEDWRIERLKEFDYNVIGIQHAQD
jgi:hypothetical protein